MTGVRFTKFCCLRGARIDRGRLGVRLDLAKAVGVADGQVVETPVDGRVPRDRKGGLVILEIECLPMNETDAQPIVSRLTRRQACRQSRLACARAARRSVHDGSGAQLEREIVAVDNVDIGREATPERVLGRVDRVLRQWVVIAGQQDDRACPGPSLELPQ